MDFRQATLDNGLEIVAECNPRAYSSALAFFVKTGSRDETDEIAGVSHFLEHMAFKGTATRSAEDVNRELDEIGSHSNAFTSEEQTVYYATVLPEYLDRAVELLSDMLRPALRDGDFDLEKQVILEEIAKYEDQPPFGAHEKCMAAHFTRHPLARSVLGTTASVGALSRDQMLAYFERRYSPKNIALVATGNVDFDRLVEQAARSCGHWQPFETSRQVSRAARQQAFQVIHKDSAVQQYVVQIANGPAAEDEDRHAGRILATILGDESGSRFFWEMIDTGLAECAAIGSYEFQGTGIFMTYLCCAPDDVRENLERIERIEREVERDGVAAEELAQAQNKIVAHVVLQSERPGNRLFSVGGNWIQRREYRTIPEVIAQYRSVRVEDIAALLAKYPLSTNTTVAMGPLKQLPGAS